MSLCWMIHMCGGDAACCQITLTTCLFCWHHRTSGFCTRHCHGKNCCILSHQPTRWFSFALRRGVFGHDFAAYLEAGNGQRVTCVVFSERYMLSPVRLSSVRFVHLTQAVVIFRNIYTAFGTLVIRLHPRKILWRSSQGNPSGGGVKHKRGSNI